MSSHKRTHLCSLLNSIGDYEDDEEVIEGVPWYITTYACTYQDVVERMILQFSFQLYYRRTTESRAVYRKTRTKPPQLSVTILILFNSTVFHLAHNLSSIFPLS